MKCLALFALAAPLFCQPLCTFDVTPGSFSISGEAGTFSDAISVMPNGLCSSWTASTTATWLHITSGALGNGVGKVSFTADANLLTTPRSATLSVATVTITVNQAGAVCTFVRTPDSATAPVGGTTGAFQVRTACTWQPQSNQNFIVLTNNVAVTGNGTVNYTVAPNTCVVGRTGTIAILNNTASPPTFPITQDGSPDNLALSPRTATLDPAGGDGRLAVTTGDTCGWSASSDVSWLQITSGSFGTGNGFVSYHVLANATGPRTGNIRVGAQVFTVSQDVTAPPPVTLAAVTNGATNGTGPISPGEIVVLYGTNMGPSTLVSVQLAAGGRSVTKSLAGTRVLFDGVPGAMIYTLDRQVSAVVPYSVGSTTQIQVEYQGVLSKSLSSNVQSAAPGIFSRDSSGLGPGAILNQDLSLNSGGNPANRGSIVAIYCTGGGVTNPASTDAGITGTPLPLLTQQVTVTIGGIGAKVTYSGGAPGAVAGLTQINAEVPAGVTPGQSVPVVVKIGNFQSRDGVTLAVQ